MAKKIEKLFEPLTIRNVTIKNRIVKSSQWLGMEDLYGYITERNKAAYAAIAKGGVGLIIIGECVCEHPLGQSFLPHIRVDHDRYIPKLKELADVIHQYDARCFLQVTHGGPCHRPFDGEQPIGPSVVDPPVEPGFSVCREMAIDEIHRCIESYAQAALRVKKAGFDGCEIHLAHYALANAFLSRIQNKRQDEFGCQSLENRALFATRILKRTRELVGSDFVVGVRMSAIELGHPLGTTNEEAVEFAKMFVEAGDIDYIQSSGYGYNEVLHAIWAPDQIVYPEIPKGGESFAKRIKEGALIQYAEKIKKAVSIPVSCVGRLDYENGEAALRKGQIDMVWLGRRLWADPAYANKVKEGRFDDIRPCAGCFNCVHHLFIPSLPTTPIAYIQSGNAAIKCRWNGFMGREQELGCDGIDFPQVAKKKKIMVVGAGPGGMEAARVAALRGHEVHLYDKEKNLGGLLPLAAFIKGTEFDDLAPTLKWYEGQLKKIPNIKLNLGVEVDATVVEKVKPDAVILSPGSTYEIPQIPGINGSNVVTTNQLKEKAQTYLKYLGSGMMSALSKIYLPVGNCVAILGGDLKGLEAAEFLVKRGRKVTVLEESDTVGEGMNFWIQFKFFPWMEAHPNIAVYKGVTYEKIDDKGIIIRTEEGKSQHIAVDTIMVIERDRKNYDLYNAIKDKAPEVHIIGDAKEDKNAWLEGAVHDGVSVGMKV